MIFPTDYPDAPCHGQDPRAAVETALDLALLGHRDGRVGH